MKLKRRSVLSPESRFSNENEILPVVQEYHFVFMLQLKQDAPPGIEYVSSIKIPIVLYVARKLINCFAI